MDELPDSELIERVRNGDRRAFTQLTRRYQERIYWVARRVTGRHDEAEDIAQETFVKAYLALGDFRGASAFFTWLYRIAMNLALNSVRKRQVLTYLQHSELVRRVLPSDDRPDTRFELNELEDRLEKAVAALPERQRAVFVMRFFDELTYEEISSVLKTSVGGLKADYFHAVRKVQEMMRDEVPHADTRRQ